ncbi:MULTISPECIES: hypothetical protein [unclassified Rhizobium]|uniref:hypothetical protein n=1 Tax=unclassified Rhizobium TaxID=2613769 RepID=UPI0012E37FC7|nr:MULTISPECIES: hypothetical protein [unclassified Rhizobium]
MKGNPRHQKRVAEPDRPKAAEKQFNSAQQTAQRGFVTAQHALGTSETIGEARVNKIEKDLASKTHPAEENDERHQHRGKPKGSQGKKTRPVLRVHHP